MNRRQLILNIAKQPLINELINKNLLSKKQLIEFVLLEIDDTVEVTPELDDDEEEEEKPRRRKGHGYEPDKTQEEVDQQRAKLDRVFQAMAVAIGHMEKLSKTLEKMIPVVASATKAPKQQDPSFQESLIKEEVKEITNRKKILDGMKKTKQMYDDAAAVLRDQFKITSTEEGEVSNRHLIFNHPDDPISGNLFGRQAKGYLTIFDLTKNKELSDFESAANKYDSGGRALPLAKAAYALTQLKRNYKMIDNLISRVGGGRVTYDTGKLDRELRDKLLDKLDPAYEKITTDTGPKDTKSLSTSEYFEALKSSLRSGIPIRGYLKPAGSDTPEEPEEIGKEPLEEGFYSADWVERYGKDLEQKLIAFKNSANKLEKSIDKLQQLYGDDKQVTSKSFFDFFENLKKLSEESKVNFKNHGDLVKSMKTTFGGKREPIVVDFEGKKYLITGIKIGVVGRATSPVDVKWQYPNRPHPKIETYQDLYKELPNVIKSLKDQERQQIQYQKSDNIIEAQNLTRQVSNFIKKFYETVETIDLEDRILNIYEDEELFKKGSVQVSTIVPKLQKQVDLLKQNYSPKYVQQFKLGIYEKIRKTLEEQKPEETEPEEPRSGPSFPPGPDRPPEMMEIKLKAIIERMLRGTNG